MLLSRVIVVLSCCDHLSVVTTCPVVTTCSVVTTCPNHHAGQVNVQLESLENKSEVHSSLDLLDERGRKPVGGKVEVFVRLREPLTGADSEQ